MRIIERSKFPFWYILGLGFINIFQGLVIILTLGLYTSSISLPYVIMFHKWELKRKRNKTKTRNL